MQMELNAKTLQEVTFGAKVRGYDPTEVDDFIAAVADGVEQLHDRLRRATERANRAEQQLAASQSAQSAQVVEPTPPASPEIGKVWERAVAAAEKAIDDAKEEAAQLIAKANEEADGTVATANREAESTLSSARHEAETTVSGARAEADRISAEAQAQLRRDIEQLETWRAHLRTDVDGLNDYLEAEKSRLRTHIENALAALSEYGSGVAPAPQDTATAANLTPPSPTPVAAPAYEPEAAPAVSWQEESHEAPSVADDSTDDHRGDDSNQADEQENWTPSDAVETQEYGDNVDLNSGDDVQAYDPAPTSHFNFTSSDDDSSTDNWSSSQWGESSDQGGAEASQTDGWANQGWGTDAADESTESPGWAQSSWATPAPAEPVADDADADDPFLAELRRAVQDDGPLGPRDEHDASIDNLYADEESDKNGFFRRKK